MAKKIGRKTAVFVIFFLLGSIFFYKKTFAQTPCPCAGSSCMVTDCEAAKQIIKTDHKTGRKKIIDYFGNSNNQNNTGGSGQIDKYQKWLFAFAKEHFIRAMMKMTEQLSAVGMQQVFVIGTMMDAKHQLETQRLFQSLQAQAHKDYQPSRDFCWFGTNARSLAHSEQKSRLNTQALNARHLERMLGTQSSAGAFDEEYDRLARWNQFKTNYCDPKDNNYQNQEGTGLEMVCGKNGGIRPNRDIDFTKVAEHERTLKIDFTDDTITPDEEDVLALSANLYTHDVLTRKIDDSYLGNSDSDHLYLLMRSSAAKHAVAQSSFNALIGMKSSGTTDQGPAGKQTRNFLGAAMKELGIPDNEIYKIIGENPSYYAQLEILGKKIYQNPDFYANLYDKPANVARKAAALKAIELMIDRAIFESQLRREMAISVTLSSALEDQFKAINGVGEN